MGLFRKKKKHKEEGLPKITDYTDWEKDLGFLTLIMTRKKNITKNYFIDIYSTQLKDTDYIRDTDLQKIMSDSVLEVMEGLSQNYKDFLYLKYFGSEVGLIKFITEDFYVDLTNSAIKQNASKLTKNIQKKRVETVVQKNTVKQPLEKQSKTGKA